jgi:ADP-ribosylglycohydrolase
MYGAILGDIIGSPYEFDRGKKTKDFPFFDRGCSFTDDSVMTIAVAEALMRASNTGVIRDEKATKALIVDMMKKWGHMYPGAGYGHRFYTWLKLKNSEPYNSFGNGSAMRVSSAGWMFDDLETTRKVARWTAEVTHNHPEGVKGAEATAAAIWLARTGSSKEEIREFITDEIGYDLSRTCDEIRPGYYHIESCQQTVPEAITALLEGNSFEDVIRTAVSLGGDCDTLTCIAGSIAEAYYGVPYELMYRCEEHLTPELLEILEDFADEYLYEDRLKEGCERKRYDDLIFGYELANLSDFLIHKIEVIDTDEDNIKLEYAEYDNTETNSNPRYFEESLTVDRDAIARIKRIVLDCGARNVVDYEDPGFKDGTQSHFSFMVNDDVVEELTATNLWYYAGKKKRSRNIETLLRTLNSIFDILRSEGVEKRYLEL